MREDHSNLPKLKYLEGLFPDSELGKRAHQKAADLGVAGMSIQGHEAALLKFFISIHGCRKFIEIGTLTGYSALQILQALPEGGELWTFEKNPIHAEIAEDILAEAIPDSGKKYQILIGDAEDNLKKIEAQGPFDGIFIDGNKGAYMRYLLWAEKNIRPGGLIIADNVFLWGGVWDLQESGAGNSQIRSMKELNQRLADDRFYKSCLVPTEEGLFVAIKKF